MTVHVYTTGAEYETCNLLAYNCLWCTRLMTSLSEAAIHVIIDDWLYSLSHQRKSLLLSCPVLLGTGLNKCLNHCGECMTVERWCCATQEFTTQHERLYLLDRFYAGIFHLHLLLAADPSLNACQRSKNKSFNSNLTY